MSVKSALPFWSNPNNTIQIIEPTLSAAQNYGLYNGYEIIGLKQEHIDALLNGKALAWNDGEYSTFVVKSSSEAVDGSP